MSCRSTLSVLLTLVSVLTVQGAPLGSAQKSRKFQPGAGAAIKPVTFTVVTPASDVRWKKASPLSGVKVRKIEAVAAKAPAVRPAATPGPARALSATVKTAEGVH